MGKWKPSYNTTRVFNKAWEEQYPWLSYYNGCCYCSWCDCKLSSMRKSNFAQHENTAKHMNHIFNSPTMVKQNRPPPVSKPKNKEEDGCNAFGRHVASQLKKLPVKYMLEAQCEIQHLLVQKRMYVMATMPLSEQQQQQTQPTQPQQPSQ